MSTQPVVALGLRALGAGRADVTIDVGEVHDLSTAADPYDVVLYDVLRWYADAGRELHELVVLGEVAVVALTRDLRPDLTRRVIGLGVHGLVSLHATAAEIVAAVGAARRGEPAAAPVATPLGEEVAALTPREREMLELIAAGLSNHEIAERSFLSINSVKTYIRSAYRKLGVTSRSQAVVWALQHGLGPVAEVDLSTGPG